MVKAKEDPWIRATGRRKSAISRVRMKPGTGKILVNKRELPEYFVTVREQRRVMAPLVAVGVDKNFDVLANVHGGGPAGQSGAVAMGIARAIVRSNPEHAHALREGRFLTRDSRKKERKKYGRRGARRSFQFSKR